MKKTTAILKSCVNLPVTILFYLSILFACIFLPQPNFNIILGIPQNNVSGSIDYLLFGRWIVLMITPLFVNGVIMERAVIIETLSTVRFGNRMKYKKHLMSTCYFNTGIWVLMYFIFAVFSVHNMDILSFSIIILSSYLMWATFGFVLFFLTGKKSWSGIILVLLIGGTYLLGEHFPILSKYMPSVWAMACRSTACEGTGYAASYFIAMNLISTVVSGVLFFERRKI